MLIETFLLKLRAAPEEIAFSDTIAIIDAHYQFTPTAFRNGQLHNLADQNNGSCKLLAFALLHKLSAAETLSCFGHYYREDVLQNPAGDDHQNIRNFLRSGWDGIEFENAPLKQLKETAP